MATASLALGVISICCIFFMLPTLFLAPTAIVLGLLSRGSGKYLSGKAKAGIIMGIAGLVIMAGVAIYIAKYLHDNPWVWRDYLREYQKLYGEF